MPAAGGAALVTLGFSDSTYGVFSLPFDLANFGASSCSILISPDFNSFVLNTGGTAVWALPIPNIAALAGANFLNQGLVLDSGANALGLSVSNALRGYIR